MKKIIVPISLLSVLSCSVSADWNGMMGYGSSSGMMGGWGMGIYGVIYFALAAFVFSAIFWLTYNWLVKPNKKR
jgi:uncharacterized membrane protein